MIDMKQIKENVSSKMKNYQAHEENSFPVKDTHQQKTTTGNSMAIGASIKIKGDVTGDEDLVIQGQVDGTISLKGHNVTISQSGKVRANIVAKQIIVEGQLNGDMNGDEKVVIRQTGNVHGNIVSPRVTLEDGAMFKGSIEMEPQQRSQHSAAPTNTLSTDKASELKSA